jgi:hypothetical protein
MSPLGSAAAGSSRAVCRPLYYRLAAGACRSVKITYLSEFGFPVGASGAELSLLRNGDSLQTGIRERRAGSAG